MIHSSRGMEMEEMGMGRSHRERGILNSSLTAVVWAWA